MARLPAHFDVHKKGDPGPQKRVTQQTASLTPGMLYYHQDKTFGLDN